MADGERHSVVERPLCLEDGKRYQIKLTFDQYDKINPQPKASILIDSVRKPFTGIA
jgi:hypothetical protein